MMHMKDRPEKHKPCRNRRRETRDGVTMDWCYAIGCYEVGDMPCEYCVDRKEGNVKGKKKEKAGRRSA